MKLSDLSIKRPVFATVLSLLLVVLGMMSFTRLTLRELPAIDPPIVSVEVTYPGASAAVVETRITQLLEDAVSGIEGIETLESRSVNGRSDVTIEFALTRDIEAAANDVRDAISRVMDRIPDEADPPEIEKAESDAETIMLSIGFRRWTVSLRCASAANSVMPCVSGSIARRWRHAG